MSDTYEILRAVVQRVTFHSEETGWSVLRVEPVGDRQRSVVVTVYQSKVFPGATIDFKGLWTVHPKFGRQFKAYEATERRPSTTAALEKYIGSGLIKGVGPKTAAVIVKFFGKETLDVFEDDIDRLLEVPGIAGKKLVQIKEAWFEHKVIRDVIMFLQSHGISTLFAVRIFKKYGADSISMVSSNPYRLANDFYGIGFLTADKVALSMGVAFNSPIRVKAAVKHVLSASRENGHCFLNEKQIIDQVNELLGSDYGGVLVKYLRELEEAGELKTRQLKDANSICFTGYYAKSLFFAEALVSSNIKSRCRPCEVNRQRVLRWLENYGELQAISLSREQNDAIIGILGQNFSVLTGGPGCGKTTTIKALVALLKSVNVEVSLAAPTGRAAQRMSEVIGLEAKTIHRLLEWQRGNFKRDSRNPIEADFLIVDECSMLDIVLSASLLDAVSSTCKILFIGDADQLPSVGPGNVLKDLLACKIVPKFILSEIFRQAKRSQIIKFAHDINKGMLPQIDSPFHRPGIWQDNVDCLFIDSEEATLEQLEFIAKVKRSGLLEIDEGMGGDNNYDFGIHATSSPYAPDFIVPEKFRHVDLNKIKTAAGQVEELKAVLKKIHPWSALSYGLTATMVLERLYLEWVPKYCGAKSEIQILSPMTRGSLGTNSINKRIQEISNPGGKGKAELKINEKIFRVGDRIIHKRNNYELGVFNGDIGVVSEIDNENVCCKVKFLPDDRIVDYQKDDLVEIDLAYCITIHKSQGSEFEVVIIPVLGQHFKMLYRNLIYTGLTRARKLAIFVGTRRALAMAVKNIDTSNRQTALKELLAEQVAETFLP